MTILHPRFPARALTAAALALAACSGSVPATRYYQLAPPTPPTPPTAPATPGQAGRASETTDEAPGSVLAIEPLASEGAYDDERIVYRVDPVRLDYYQYHRWSTTPGSMISGYLQRALSGSGRFRAVVRDTTTETAAVLGGRVTAIEEIDESRTRWTAHVALELTLADPRTGAILWSRGYEQREPFTDRTPEGLARALGIALGRIAHDAAPEIASLADRRTVARSRESATIGSSR
jgi:ABC-type uncharacterized transport system auxiliary subunit